VRILKISLVEGPRRCRLIVAGKLIDSWVAEFSTACEQALADLHGRELIVDLKDVSSISPEAERILMQLMRKKVKFQGGVFMKEVLRQLARKSRTNQGPAGDDAPREDPDGSETV
jgi:hypothetical protein